MAGVTEIKIDVPVASVPQWAELSATILAPDKPRVTHTLAINGRTMPGQWVVVAARQDYDANWARQHWVTMARLEDVL
jgi:hypothetical protein